MSFSISSVTSPLTDLVSWAKQHPRACASLALTEISLLACSYLAYNAYNQSAAASHCANRCALLPPSFVNCQERCLSYVLGQLV